MARRRRDVVVEQVRGRFRVNRPVVEDGQAIFTGDRATGLRQGHGDKSRRHIAVVRNCGADHRTHGGQSGLAEEAPAVGIGLPSED